jgi:broad specificity phosphatase PhoE
MPGCENSQSAQKRFVAAVSKTADQNPGTALGVSSHGNVIGLFLNHIDDGFHREATETLRNPDVIRVVADAGEFHWDREFRLRGLDTIATSHSATPLPKRA